MYISKIGLGLRSGQESLPDAMEQSPGQLQAINTILEAIGRFMNAFLLKSAIEPESCSKSITRGIGTALRLDSGMKKRRTKQED